ncbi:2-oxoglutarate dehydrogenase E1 component [Zea mays]|uniref:2-oxoglutarate dehydrogenase E1 component n=1 Tax=Zea mays TaxID=4577 RepID=A0A1D6PBQ4_MAIZE|nr:2-oxoglutarate dehydrogenase E1 component [Zea mays]
MFRGIQFQCVLQYLGPPVLGLRSAPRTSTAAPPISSTASGARRCPGDRPSRKSSAEKRKVSRLFQSTSMHPKPVPQKDRKELQPEPARVSIQRLFEIF